MDALERRLRLPCGVTIAVQEYGVADGVPVFFLHGWPSSRWQGAVLATAAREWGLRLLAPDRPGVGASTPQPGRRLVDWPPLLGELARELGITRCRVLGISGGGPYALASAWGLPELVERVALVCGAPPLAEKTEFTGLMPGYRRLLALYRSHRKAARWLFRILHPLARVRPPRAILRLLRGAVSGPDALALSDPEMARICLAGFQGAWGGYRDGVFEDAEIYAQAWGFPLGSICQPVAIWHGLDDHNFSSTLAETLALELPQSRLHLVPDEGHYSLPIRQARPILADLLGSA